MNCVVGSPWHLEMLVSTAWHDSFCMTDQSNLSAEINTESQYLLNRGCVSFLLTFPLWFMLLSLILLI